MGYMQVMKPLTVLCALLVLSLPARAEDSGMESVLRKFEELSKEAQTLMEGWAKELGPKLEELGPLLEDLARKMGDLSAYHPPEVLENGDILIRRKQPRDTRPAPAPEPPAPPKPGQGIDL